MEVTVEAFLSFLGLFVAVNALVVGPAFYYLQKTERIIEEQHGRLTAQIKDLEITTRFSKHVLDSVIGSVGQLSIAHKFNAGLIDAAFAHRDIDQQRLTAVRKKLELEHEQAFNELMAFSTDNEVRLSSFRQLSQVYGKWISIEKMQQSLDLNPPDQDTAPVLQIYIRDLKKRLNHS